MEKPKWGGERRLRDSSSWEGTSLSFEKDCAFGFSWPQRNFRCSFCKREFKSAQALGGHMNVHRRERARMRLSPSWDSPDLNPNPNPSFSLPSSTRPPSSSAKLSPSNTAFHSSLTTAVPNSVPPSPSSLRQEKAPPVSHSQLDIMTLCREDGGKKNKGALLELTSFTRRKDARVWKANEFVRLDLKLGLLQDAKEDLDLELRLGYS